MDVKAKEVVEKARCAFKHGLTRPIEWRLSQLQALHQMVDENQDAICEVEYEDQGKPKTEVILTEVTYTKTAAAYAINHLQEWMTPHHPSKQLLQVADSVYVQKQPYGVVLIIGAWNYPLQLSLVPMVGAIAAGNTVILKLSEISVKTSALIKELVLKYMDNECIHVYEGGPEETTILLKERMDYICYTGNSHVGRIIMRAAAEHLTPVTLELGGQSPVYIHNDSHIDIVSGRFAFGKFTNCGQTCVAPDYVLCHEDIIDQFCSGMTSCITKWFGENPQKSKDYSRIINQRHFNRIKRIFEQFPAKSIVSGGTMDESDLYIAPTVVKLSSMSECHEDELFGPLIVVVPVKDENEAIEIMNQRERPLALYVFANNKKVVDHVLQSTHSGGVTVNDTIMHQCCLNLPFGGCGFSGMGNYHGKYSFDTFSHERAVVKRQQNMEMLLASRYPPYTENNLKLSNWFMTERIKGGCAVM